jgi:hypothetical protein
MPDYGYERRQDRAERVVPLNEPPSRVATVGRLESNRTRQAVKDAAYLTSTPPVVTTLMLCGNERLILARGDALQSTAGGGVASAVTTDYAYRTDVLRYTRRIRATDTGTGDYRNVRGILIGTLPLLVADPKFSATAGRGIYRISDMVAAVKESASGLMRGFWGILANGIGAPAWSAGGDPRPFIGFRSTAVDGSTVSTWTCLVIDTGGGYKLNVDTHIDSTKLHELAIVLDGAAKTIKFYIDGAVVASYTPGTGTTPGASAAGQAAMLVAGFAIAGVVGGPVTAHVDYLADGWMSAGWDFKNPQVE